MNATTDVTESPTSERYIEFRTRNGEPAVGVVVALSHHRVLNPQRDATRVDQLSTDAKGRIYVDPAVTGHIPVKVISTDWRLVLGTTLVDGWFHTGPWPVVLEKVRVLTVLATYADGTPFEGPISVSPEGEGSLETFEIVRGITEVVVPATDPFRLYASSRRPGFADAGVQSSDAAPLGKRLEIVLAAQDATKGVIEVDLTAFARVDKLLVEIIGAPYPTDVDSRALTMGGGVYASAGRKPGGYRVSVREDPTGALLMAKGRIPPGTAPHSLRVWQSDVVQVAAGQIVRVIAKSEYASAVRARLVNERGEVLAPGIVFAEPDTKLPNDWSRLNGWYNAPKPWSAFPRWPSGLTVEDGYGDLPIVDPGKRVIACEAPGYDIAFVEVVCKPGQLHDLGTVVLRPASGVIEIEIVNWDPQLTYVVELCEWAGGRLREPVILTGETGPVFRFEGLALRWYTITANNKEGQVGAWSRNARLSDTRKVARLKFEMHKAPLPEKVIQPDE
ncbi:MAG: hypothetical protein KF754_05965 [Planctomycetes bacterium]|nr:hypothetical protein [Planctomycetota bacterium]